MVEDVTLAGIAAPTPPSMAGLEAARRSGPPSRRQDRLQLRQLGELWPTPGIPQLDMRDALASIRCPVLAIQGAKDDTHAGAVGGIKWGFPALARPGWCPIAATRPFRGDRSGAAPIVNLQLRTVLKPLI